jgi:hypothetical protein
MKTTAKYSVSLNGKWCNNFNANYFESKGAIIQESRMHINAFDVFIESKLVAYVFVNQKDQINYLKENNLI